MIIMIIMIFMGDCFTIVSSLFHPIRETSEKHHSAQLTHFLRFSGRQRGDALSEGTVLTVLFFFGCFLLGLGLGKNIYKNQQKILKMDLQDVGVFFDGTISEHLGLSENVGLIFPMK